MVSMLQKQSRKFIKIVLLLSVVIIASSFIPFTLKASIGNYNPDVDVDFGNLFLIMKDNGEIMPIPGFYYGGHLIMESPILKNNFDTKNVYTIYNFGFSGIKGPGSTYVVFLSGMIEMGYNLRVFKKFNTMFFGGWGFNFIPINYSFIKRSLFLTLNGGIFLRYKLWRDCYLKLKLEAGMLYGSQLENGYLTYFRIIWPVPFIP